MTPTPPSLPSFQAGLRFGDRRRQRNTNPYEISNHTPNPQSPITPLPDNGVEIQELSSDDVDIEDADVDDDIEGEDDDIDGEEEEGGIEEGPVRDGRRFLATGRRPPQLPDQGTESRTTLLIRILQMNHEAHEAHASLSPVPMDIDPPFDAGALGLKEIGNLASWTVSSCKPGCGVEALRDDDTGLFWQSDGPQPHHLNIHFSRLVCIRAIRIYLDFEADESYTPTRITILAGTGYHDLIPFSSLEFTQPKGWIEVPLDHVGGGEDGKTLRAFLVQVRVMENHQNGKDTHVRGMKIYARDERVGRGVGAILGEQNEERKSKAVIRRGEKSILERGWITEPDWMGEPELR